MALCNYGDKKISSCGKNNRNPPINLPSALAVPGIRFIKLGDKDERLKRPWERGWNIFNLDELKRYLEKKAAQWDAEEASGRHAKLKEKGKYVPRRPKYRGRLNNYGCDDPEFQKWLKRGKNYGVTGAGNLVKLESDDVDRWEKLGVMALLPETFTVQSSTLNRKHFYYICPGISDSPLFDPETGKDIGHIRGTGDENGRGGMVVGPGCLHPSGARYAVVKDIPIASIAIEILEDVKRILRRPASKKVGSDLDRREDNGERKSKHEVKRTSENHYYIEGQIKIGDIAMPANIVSDDGTEIQGCHPIHGSTTGKNFSINIDNNVWHCFRCDSGGGPLEFLAVEAGLIDCRNAGPRCLRGDLFLQVLEIARDRGYYAKVLPKESDEQFESAKEPISDEQFKSTNERIELSELPEDLPPNPMVVIKGPPRIGKTHWSVQQLLKAGNGNYISHAHSIVQHALEAFRKVGGQSAVWLEGMHKEGMCRKGEPDCRNCELSLGRHNYYELCDTARELLRQFNILTKNEIPLEFCPYYTLKLAEKEANYCFTVVHFINGIKPRNLTVLDEDPTLSYFYTPSAQLFKYRLSGTESKMDSSLGKSWRQVQKIRTSISKKLRLDETDHAILSLIDSLETIKRAMDTTLESGLDGYEINLCCKKIKDIIISKERTDSKIANKILERIERYCSFDESSETSAEKILSSLAYPYLKLPVHALSSSGNSYKSVYLIGDAIKPIYHMSWLSSKKRKLNSKVVIIGNTLAELFAEILGNAIVIEIPKFKYSKNYVVIPIDKGNEDRYDDHEKNQRINIEKFIKALIDDPNSKTRRPIMMLTGSKKSQERLIRSLGGIAHASQEEGEVGQQWNHLGGYLNIFYQNSVISRGLDVDQYNLIVVHNADFAQPFWSAAKEAKEERSKAILSSIISDETTNSVLRISPIIGRNELHPKILVIRRADLWKVRYLDEQILGGKLGGRTPNINDVVDVITENNLTGTVNLNWISISVDDMLPNKKWENAVKDNKLVDLFRIELNSAKGGSFTEAEIEDTMNKICVVLNEVGEIKGLSISDMKRRGLRCKSALIRPSLDKLHYCGMISFEMRNRGILWSLNPQKSDMAEVLPASVLAENEVS